MKHHPFGFGRPGDPRSMCDARGHHFGPQALQRDGFAMGEMRDVPGFGYEGDERDNPMMGNGRDWRGGPRGRDRQDFGFGRGHGRPERPFEQGDLRWLVLDLIAAQPRHGYEIIKAIEDEMNGRYAPSPGVIYPTLTFLEETGLIASEAQATKKLYTITDEGRAALDTNAAAITAVKDRMAAMRARFGGPPAPEMMRAMENLRAAIQVRLSKGELSAESLASITAALDRAAGEIERS